VGQPLILEAMRSLNSSARRAWHGVSSASWRIHGKGEAAPPRPSGESHDISLVVRAALAQQESELISQRTWPATVVLKARGKTFGTASNMTPEAAPRGARKGAAKTAKARFYTAELGLKVAAAWAAGASLQGIADALNADRQKVS